MESIYLSITFKTMLSWRYVIVSGFRWKLAFSYKPLSLFYKEMARCFLLVFSFHEWITSVSTIVDKGIWNHLIEFPVNISIPWCSPKLYEQYKYSSSVYQRVIAQSLFYDNHLNTCFVWTKQQETVISLWQCSNHSRDDLSAIVDTVSRLRINLDFLTWWMFKIKVVV